MNTGVPSFDRTATKASSQGVNESGWNYPTIYDAIKAAGETVVASSVIQVYANNNNWTDTKLTINGNEKVWIDTHSVGAWNYGGTSGMVNADGYSDSTSWPVRPGTQFDYQGKVIPTAMLMGTVGTSNKLFEVGKDLWNYVPPQSSGEFYIMQNDGNPGGTMHDDNTGVQTVRVIITR
jgi:hypothetical protein